MKYAEFRECQSFELEELLAFSYGTLVDDPPVNFEARLAGASLSHGRSGALA